MFFINSYSVLKKKNNTILHSYYIPTQCKARTKTSTTTSQNDRTSMKTLISHFSEPQFFSKFPTFSSNKTKPIFILHYKCLLDPQKTILSSIRATNSAATYNGWDDYRIRLDSDELGESNHFKKILISLGINDKKYMFTCILGFVCALAISRVRVSSIIVFPAVAIVFAIGFSFGFDNGKRKPHKNLGFNGSKTRVFVDKLKGLVEIFDGFDVKISDLKNDMKNAIEYKRVGFGDLEGYVDEIEAVGGLVLNARNLVDDCIGGVLVEGQEVGKNPNQKNSRKKKEIGDKGFGLFGFMGRFFKDNAVDSKSGRVNFVRKDLLAKDVVDRGREDIRAVEGVSNSMPTMDGSIPYRGSVSNDTRNDNFDGIDQETKRNLQRGETDTMDAYMNTKDSVNVDEYNHQNIGFTSNRRFSLNMSANREFRNWVSEDSMSKKVEFDFSNKHLDNEGPLQNQQTFENSNGAYEAFDGRGNLNFGRFRESIREERMNEEDELYSRKYQSRSENDRNSFSTSAVSDDMLFDRYLRKAKDLLKLAKETLKARDDEILAEEMLQESAKLLGHAISLKPMSLLAIGQLGNTYLLHGELKLKISRELRTYLSKNGDFRGERSNLLFLEDTFPSKDGLENSLISACEECESLLVEAGRKYRMALSIDGNDVRALYNWGLALSFRAQLIADVGPEAALDADKLFLAAIDKFNAMMSRSNDYAPDALFRWGMALQQRSRLRPNNSRDKVKLLQQAKRLYEDAVSMGSSNLQVRKALSSCITELNFY